MEFDISRLRDAFGGSRTSEDPYKYRTPPYVPEEQQQQMSPATRNMFAGGGSVDLYPDSYLNAGREQQPQQQEQAPRMRDPMIQYEPIDTERAPWVDPFQKGHGVALAVQGSAPSTSDELMPDSRLPAWSPPVEGKIPMGEQVPISATIPTKGNRKTPAQDVFNQAIRDMPQLNNPSVLRRISAALLGGATQEGKNAEYIVHKPYYDAMMPWEKKMPYLQQAANIERQAQTAEDADYQRYLNNEYRFQNLERQTREGQQNIGIRQQVADTGQFRAETDQDYKNRSLKIKEDALSGVHRIIFSKDGSAVLVRKNGKLEEIDPKILDGYTLKDKIALQTAGALKIVESRGDIQAAIEEFKAGARQDLENSKQDDAATPNEIKQAKINRGQDIKRIKPEYAQFVKINAQTGDIKVEVPEAGMFSGGYSPKRRADITAEINAWIDNGTEFPTPGTVTEATSTVTPTTPPRKVNLPGRTTPPAKPSQFTGKQQKTKGANPPPIEQRQVGQEHEWPNGNVGRWTGTKWDIVQLKVK